MPITEEDLVLNPCPVCGRRPELISYNAGNLSNHNSKTYYRFVCAHGSRSNIRSCITNAFDRIWKCQKAWNDGEYKNNFSNQKRPTRTEQMVSHEKFVEFLGGE